MPVLTLDQLVEEACAQFAPADAPTRYYAAALHHAAAFRRELVAGQARFRKTAYLDLGDDRTVDLPADCVEYAMLGLLLPGWTVTRNLVYNGALALDPDWQRLAGGDGAGADAYGEDYLLMPGAEEQALGGHEAGPGYCGYGHPHHGAAFRIDRQQGRIICCSRVPAGAVLVLDYLSFEACEGEDITLDALAHSWGLQFLLARLYLQKQNLGLAREHERLAGVEKTKYENRTRNFSLAGALRVQHTAAAQRFK